MGRLILRDPDEVVMGRRRGKADTEWHSLLAPARRKPGRWYEVRPPYDTPGAAASRAYEINSNQLTDFPPGKWEACSRTRHLEDGTSVGVLSIKFLGD